MELAIGTLVSLGALAATMEVVDAALGMMYGTLLCPVLLLLGFEPAAVVPAILLSQALGGLVGAIGHHLRKNSDFSGPSRDLRIALAIIVPGLVACALGVYTGQLVSGVWIRVYIGVLVVVMGGLCLRPIAYAFSWKKLWAIGLLAGFNKALSGGGFGPVTSTGKILGGVDPRVSVGTTTLAEVPVCLVSFLLWWGFGGTTDGALLLALCLGALVGGWVGPLVTARLTGATLRRAVGALAVATGAWLLVDLGLGLRMGQ